MNGNELRKIIKFDKRKLNKRLSKKEIRQMLGHKESDILLPRRIINAKYSAIYGDINNTCRAIEFAINELVDLYKNSQGEDKCIIAHISKKMSFIFEKFILLSVLVNSGQNNGIVFDELNKPDLKEIVMSKYMHELEKIEINKYKEKLRVFADITNILQTPPIHKYKDEDNEIKL